MIRQAAICLLLLFSVSPGEELLPLGEEVPLDEFFPEGRDRIGLGFRSGSALPRARGEWSQSGLRVLGEWRGNDLSQLRATTALARGSFRLVLGSLSREEGLLGGERRRLRLGSMGSIRTRESRISLSEKGRAAFLDWRAPRGEMRIAWEKNFGAHLDARSGPLRFSWRGYQSGSACSAGLRSSVEGESIDLEFAFAGEGWNRRGLRIRLAGETGSLNWSGLGMLLSGPRPAVWKSRGWIGSSAGSEASVTLSWRRGSIRFRSALRWRRGIGLAEGRRRQEAFLAAQLRLAKGTWRVDLRRLEDFDLDLQEFPQAFPIWTETRNSRWEGRLAWKGDLNWEAIIRRNGESANSVMLKLGSEERNWKGLIHSCRLDLFRSSPDNSFRYVGGDFLQRSGRTLHGRGALLSGTLRINWQDFSLRLNSDAGPGLSPRLGLSLYWQPA